MKRITTVMLSAAAVVAMTAGLVAQAKPNFAGKWTLDAPAAPAAPPAGGAPGGAPGGGGGRGGGRGGAWGQEATITQDATTLTIDYTQGQNPVKLTYKLDGTESKNTTMGRGGAPTETVAKAAWDGAKLKIVTTTANGEQTRLVSLDGGKLAIETTQPGMDGAAMTTKVTYTKAP